jgi:hypothetical protein
MMQDSFDFEASQAGKQHGMEVAASNRAELLAIAREVAHYLGRDGRTVTADEVQRMLVYGGYKPSDLGNAAGSIFKDGDWLPVGHFCSLRVSNHAREMKAWKLKEFVRRT